MNHLYEKTIQTTPIFNGRVISLREEVVELPDGQLCKRELVTHPGAVAIIPMTNNNTIILVRQFRKALEKTIVEIPAGKLEKGEVPEDSARRELEEETGYLCSQLIPLRSFYTSPGFANEYIHMFMAKGLTKGMVHRDEDEFMDVLELTVDEAKQLIGSGEICDAKTMYAILYLESLM